MGAFAEYRLRVPASEAARVRSALGGLLPLIGEEARLAEVAPGGVDVDNVNMKAIIAEVEADDDGTRYPVETVVGTSTPGSRLRGLRMREGITQKELTEKLGIQQHHVFRNGKRNPENRLGDGTADFQGVCHFSSGVSGVLN